MCWGQKSGEEEVREKELLRKEVLQTTRFGKHDTGHMITRRKMQACVCLCVYVWVCV